MRIRLFSAVFCLLSSVAPLYAGSGTEGAAFLDIPVGAGPAAMGTAYTALSNDAYSATYNPAGLGFLGSTQFSGQHLSYLESLHYEYLSFAVPLSRNSRSSALGGSVQYLGSGDINGLDDNRNPTGTYSSYYASYNLSYGKALSDKLSLGLTGKLISAKLDDVSAKAYAADLGSMYQLDKRTTLAATVTNIGSKLKFLNDGDSLPLAFHLSGAFQPNARWKIAGEGIYSQTGLASFRVGGEWRPLSMLALRTGYRTDTVKELSALAGYSAGLGLTLWKQELAYAWLPYGDLGTTHYISLLMKFGEDENDNRNLIKYQHVRMPRATDDSQMAALDLDHQELMELLSESRSDTAMNRVAP